MARPLRLEFPASATDEDDLLVALRKVHQMGSGLAVRHPDR